MNPEYLNSKIAVEDGHIVHKSASSNITRLSDKVYSFTEYNFLPGPDGQLDGHYTFFVNSSNFEYVLYKSSDYGGLTWTKPMKFAGFIGRESLNEFEVRRCDSIVATKLMGSYFYDPEHVNHQGANVIPGCDVKRSLVTDYRGYIWSGSKPQVYSKPELRALALLDGYKQPRKLKLAIRFSERKRTGLSVKVGSGEITGVLYEIPVKYGKRKGYLLRQVGPLSQRYTALFLDGEKVCHDILNHDFKKFVSIIPEILSNYAN